MSDRNIPYGSWRVRDCGVDLRCPRCADRGQRGATLLAVANYGPFVLQGESEPKQRLVVTITPGRMHVDPPMH